jgi:hypothetical protein
MKTLNKYSLVNIPHDVSKGEEDKPGISRYEAGLIRFVEHANTPVILCNNSVTGKWNYTVIYENIQSEK